MNLHRGLAAASVGACVILGGWAPPPSPPPERLPPPGEGVICGWAIYTVAMNVGAKCFPGQNPEYQASLREIVDKYDAYVARNAKDLTPAQVAEFKRTQGASDTPAEHLCQGDAVAIYRAFEKMDRANMRSEIEKLLARDGPPSWGTCF